MVLARIEPRGKGPRIEVGHHGPDRRAPSRTIRRSPHRFVHQPAVVDAHVGRLLFFEDRLVREHGGEGEAGSIDERLQRLAEARAEASSPGRMQAVRAPSQGRENRLGRPPAEHVRIARRRLARFGPAEDRLVGGVQGKGHVDRSAMIQRLGNQPLGFIGDVLRRQDGAGATVALSPRGGRTTATPARFVKPSPYATADKLPLVPAVPMPEATGFLVRVLLWRLPIESRLSVRPSMPSNPR